MINDSKYLKKIIKLAGQAIGDFNMIDNNDHILVCLSGGKDSWTLLQVLQILQKKAPVKFKLTALNIDPGFKNYQADRIKEYCQKNNIKLQQIKTTIQEIIIENKRPGTSFCSFCARLRRGSIYSTAKKLKITKIALGHHLDDLCETVLLNLFFSGQLKAMAPIMQTDDLEHLVIRPLCYVPENLITEHIKQTDFPLISCACGKHNTSQQRIKMKNLIKELSIEIPDIRSNMFKAMSHVIKTHLLDRELFDFESLNKKVITL